MRINEKEYLHEWAHITWHWSQQITEHNRKVELSVFYDISEKICKLNTGSNSSLKTFGNRSLFEYKECYFTLICLLFVSNRLAVIRLTAEILYESASFAVKQSVSSLRAYFNRPRQTVEHTVRAWGIHVSSDFCLPPTRRSKWNKLFVGSALQRNPRMPGEFSHLPLTRSTQRQWIETYNLGCLECDVCRCKIQELDFFSNEVIFIVLNNLFVF